MHDHSLGGVDLNLLVLLRALLRERQVTRAARQVGLSQSAASHALARLRQLYADPLLVRNGKRLELTERALRLQPEVEQGLEHLEATLRGATAFDPRATRRRFTISAADYLQATLLGPLLTRLASEAAGFELTWVSFTNSLELLEAGQADLALLATRSLAPEFRSRRLYSDSFVCMARRDHPLASRKRISLAQYLEAPHVLVAPGGSPGSFIDSELNRMGHERRIVALVSSFLAVPAIVAESNLLSTGPAELWRKLAPLYPVKLSPLPFSMPSFDIDAVWHTRRNHDPALAFLLDRLCQAAAETFKTGAPARGASRSGG